MKAKFSLTDQKAEIEASQKEVSDFFKGIIPNFVREAGGILSDTVRFWRWKNQVNIIKKVKEKIEKSGLKKHQVPLKTLLPILENGSLEEDTVLQEKWANMLANAVTMRSEVKPNYAEILKDLSPLEVAILDKLYEESNKEPDYQKRKSLQFSKQKIMEVFHLSDEKADLIIENLYRLNLCQPPASHGGVAIGNYPIMLRTNDFFEFTTFGYFFVKSCRWEGVKS